MTDDPRQTSRPSPVALGILLAVLAAVGFSTKAILIKLAYRDPVDPVTLLALRMLFSMPFFLAVALWTRGTPIEPPLGARDYRLILLLGLSGYYLSSLLDFMGLEYISAGLERLIVFLYPTLVVLLSAMFLKRPIGRREIGALALSYAGIALVFLHDLSMQANEGLLLGAALVFVSTVTYSSYFVGVGTVIVRLGAMRLTAWSTLIATVATLLQFVLTRPLSALAQPLRVYGLALTLAVFATVLPVFMLSAAIRLIGPSHTALVGSVGPVATIALAHVFLGEPVSALQIAGTVPVLAGVLMISLRRG